MQVLIIYKKQNGQKTFGDSPFIDGNLFENRIVKTVLIDQNNTIPTWCIMYNEMLAAYKAVASLIEGKPFNTNNFHEYASNYGYFVTGVGELSQPQSIREEVSDARHAFGRLVENLTSGTKAYPNHEHIWKLYDLISAECTDERILNLITRKNSCIAVVFKNPSDEDVNTKITATLEGMILFLLSNPGYQPLSVGGFKIP